MYIIDVKKRTRAYSTAGEVWLDENVQAFFKTRMTPQDFKVRLDSGETLKSEHVTVYLKGSPAVEDLDSCIENYGTTCINTLAVLETLSAPIDVYAIDDIFTDLPGEAFAMNNLRESNLHNCFSVDDIHTTLDIRGLPNEDFIRALYLLDYLAIRVSRRFPSDYADELNFDDIAQRIASMNTRRITAGDKRKGVELWKIAEMTKLDGTPKRTNARRASWLNCEVAIVVLYRGADAFFDIIVDAGEKLFNNFIKTTTVVDIVRNKDGEELTIVTRNSIYILKCVNELNDDLSGVNIDFIDLPEATSTEGDICDTKS